MLKEGEVICDQCNGTGFWEENGLQCYKCLGKGKLDWVSNAMGGYKPIVVDWGTSISSNNKIEDKFVKAMARKIAKKIDEEILASLSDSVSLKNYTRRIKFDN